MDESKELQNNDKNIFLYWVRGDPGKSRIVRQPVVNSAESGVDVSVHDLTEFFYSKITSIRESVQSGDGNFFNSPLDVGGTCALLALQECTAAGIRKVVLDSPSSCSSLDLVPPMFLKNILTYSFHLYCILSIYPLALASFPPY
ncbi:hypothetical protein HELRODRAFT_170019 [Helobdella robusta]|uniref:Uncharacterized protein n=1 Tax=Helobdella robusta TaxID=6412 RepID=T1F2J5_HELRO|nr:hypothetical protein HELRODRAFT_170019 [Helobdella robusta]ESO07487.1 hypothetical protein HELRODRAFT_170019 [Helobdella robusta]